MKNYDIVVIGAGIAGLTSAIYLKRANANFAILESGKVGGQLSNLKEVENYPGFPKTSGEAILSSLEEQVKELGINIEKGSVQTILKDQVGFRVVSDFESYLCKAVIVATGISRNQIKLEGESEFLGRGVSYCATCDGSFFKNDDVVVYGNNHVAIEEALYLSNLVKTLYLVVDGEKLVGEEAEKLLSLSKVKPYINHKIQKISGDMFGVSDVTLDDGTVINVHGVFPFTGSKSSADFLRNLNPSMNGNFIVTDENMKTNIDGLYAIGDVRQKGLRQLVTAASDGAIAALDANKYVKNK
ncbi:MAG: NAD(P)/FAD-dependent oxidoreductase [Bacilli bacterium]|nr:NAD(P)/FAD-dependent oxidoreductase [Bacilli bacterium]